MAYLNDHPPVRSQFRCPRRARPSGVVVVHTAENAPDFVAFDGGAEAVASWITRRTDPGSYHDLVDSDSCIRLVDYSCEAFHDGTGTNPHSYGVSAATRADVWPLAPDHWRQGAIAQMAAACRRYASWLKHTQGLSIPARRITVLQARAGEAGFISHAELDPGRRSDPGKGFPWADFLRQYGGIPTPAPLPTPPTTRGHVDVKVPVLAQGAEGGAVRSLQSLLVTKAGQGRTLYAQATSTHDMRGVDGVYGARTAEAVRNVQRYFDTPRTPIAVDGVCGGQTWPLLFL